MRLLIVDDELWSRQLVRNVLPWETYGIDEILEASNGDEAIKIYEKMEIELTITDMRMPGLDGAGLLEYLRETDNKTEVIVMSGYEDYKYLHAALKTKAIDYLLKPIVAEDLVKAVQVAIQKIKENNNHLYIEKILVHEGLKEEFNYYFQIKSQLFNNLMKASETSFIMNLNNIELEFFAKNIDQNLFAFIASDLSRLIVKLEIENGVVNSKYDVVEFNEIKTRLMNVFYIIRDSIVNNKMSILEVQKYIDSHFTESITLSNIAERFYVSKEHLSRQFKKDVEISVQKYITNKKIEYAKQLFRRYSKISISGVSLMVGYLDLQYFYRVFKKATGVTPVQYKNDISILS